MDRGMSKHTPGPWKKVIDSGGQINIVAPDGYNLAVIPDPNQEGGRGEEDFKNGDVLAAAPEMLEALKLIRSSLSIEDEENLNNWTAVHAMDQVIAKAEGK